MASESYDLQVISIQNLTANTTTAIGSTVVNGYIREIYSIKYSNPNATVSHVTLGTASRIIDDDTVPAQNSHYQINAGVPIANNKPGEQMYAYATSPLTIVIWYKDIPGSL